MPLPLDTRATTTETPKATKEEPPGKEDMRAFEPFPNLETMFFARAAEKGDAPFLWRKSEGQWHSLSWEEAARPVAALAEGLRDDGRSAARRVRTERARTGRQQRAPAH